MIEYKCEKCKSIWNTDKSLNICPFCGNIICDLNHKSSPIDRMDSLLLKIKQELGKEAFSQDNYKKEHIIAYMLDYAPHLKKQIELFEIALKANVYNDFSIAIKTNPLNTLKIKYNLANNYFLNDSSIDAIVGWFSVIFDIKTTNVSESTKQKNQANITQKNALINTNNRTKKIDDNAKRKSNNTETTYYVSLDYSMFTKVNQTSVTSSQDSGDKSKKIDLQTKKIMKSLQNYEKTDKQPETAFLVQHFDEIYELAQYYNNYTAMYYVGYCYEHGIGVSIDLKLAKDYYKKSMAGSEPKPKAELSLASIYECENNTNLAIQYYESAVNHGDLMAAIKLVLLYVNTSISNNQLLNLEKVRNLCCQQRKKVIGYDYSNMDFSFQKNLFILFSLCAILDRNQEDKTRNSYSEWHKEHIPWLYEENYNDFSLDMKKLYCGMNKVNDYDMFSNNEYKFYTDLVLKKLCVAKFRLVDSCHGKKRIKLSSH